MICKLLRKTFYLFFYTNCNCCFFNAYRISLWCYGIVFLFLDIVEIYAIRVFESYGQQKCNLISKNILLLSYPENRCTYN